MTNLSNQRKNGNYVIKVIIGFAILALFFILPPFAKLTPAGMKTLGMFVMVIYFCLFNELTWPGVLAIAGMSFILPQLYPDTTTNPLYRTMELSWGYWMIPFLIASLILTYALTKVGFMRRMAAWIMSLKIARKSPWAFTFTLFFVALFLGLWFDPTASLVFCLGFSKEILERLGYKKGELYPVVVIMGLGFSITIAFGMTPISHPLPILALGVYQSITGSAINFVTYMALGIPVGLICFIGMLLIIRYIIKPDLSKIANADFDKAIGEKSGPMDRRELLTVVIAVLVFASWLFAGVLNVVAAQAAITAFFNQITSVMPAILGVALLAIIRVDGEPLLRLEEGLSKGVTWNIVLLMSALFMLGNALAVPEAGFNDTIASFMAPFVNGGLSSFVIMFVIMLVIILLTNVMNNIPIVMLMLSVCIPLAGAIGISPLSVALLITISGEMAFVIPSAFPAIAIIYGDEWTQPKLIFRYGFMLMIWSIIAVSAVGYPLSHLMFG